MKLTTPVQLPRPKNSFQYGYKFFTLGSCFAGHLAEKLHYFGFAPMHNPVGILFHPFAIEQFLTWVDGQPVNKLLFVEHQKSWKSYQVHSEIYASSSLQLTKQLNSAVEKSKVFLKNSNAIFITLGTSFVYKHISTNTYIANCQKQPQSYFNKELINIERLIDSLHKSISILKKYTPASIYLSVSPVRHIKDGIVQNNLSKANLLSAVHHVVAFHQNVNYLPTYEVVMDELRDYRFYKRDLIHPNELAVDYIWEKFSQAFFDERSLLLMKKVDGYRKLNQHRMLNVSFENEIQHKKKIQDQKENLFKIEPQLHL